MMPMMTDREREIKQKLVLVTKAIRKKYNAIKSGRVEDEAMLENLYKPITKPLVDIVAAVPQSVRKTVVSLPKRTKRYRSIKRVKLLQRYPSSTQSKPVIASTSSQQLLPSIPEQGEKDVDSGEDNGDENEYEDASEEVLKVPPTPPMSPPGINFTNLNLKNINVMAARYIDGMIKYPEKYDSQYGLRFEDGSLKMGDATITFEKLSPKFTLWRRGSKLDSFMGTRTLLNLLFLNDAPKEISPTIASTYAKVLLLTNATKRNYDESRGRQGSRSAKYTEVIKPLLDRLEEHSPTASLQRRISTRLKSGTSITNPFLNRKQLINKPTNYVYWDTPRELVERLRLLWASKEAGNTGHNNEIISILEELREEGIIY